MLKKVPSSENQQAKLSRTLTSRHIQLIVFGCTIGSGLFIGSLPALQLTGSSIILDYLLAGLVVYLLMRQLGEMVVEEPAAGSFSYFAHKYWGEQASFIAGWNSWILYILVSMAELSALGQLMQFWFLGIPNWITVLICFTIINLLNLLSVKVFAETEFWMSLIKVVAVSGMIAFGSFLLLTKAGSLEAGLNNLANGQDGFFAGGFSGFMMALVPTLFSLGGLELVGIAAAEAQEPKKVIPQVINQTIFLLLFFYIGSLTVSLMLLPLNQLISENSSPFVLIFSRFGSKFTASVLNIIIFSAALSAYHSCTYASSRMLFSLAEQKNAPACFAKTNKRDVPFMAVLVGAFGTFFCVILNYLFPKKAFSISMMLVVAAVLIGWSMISLSHLKFKKAMKKQRKTTTFEALLYPIGNYVCLSFIAFIAVAFIKNGQWLTVILIPAWLIFLSTLYLYKKKHY